MSITFAKEIHPTSPAHKIGFVGVLLPSLALIAAFIFSMPSASQHFALLAAPKKITLENKLYSCNPVTPETAAAFQQVSVKANESNALVVGNSMPTKDTVAVRAQLNDRKVAMRGLWQSDPNTALTLVLSDDLSKKFSTWTKNCVESYQSVTGVVTEYAFSPVEGKEASVVEPTFYELKTATGNTYTLYAANALHAPLTTGTTIEVRGYVLDKTILFDGSLDVATIPPTSPNADIPSGFTVKAARADQEPVMGDQHTLGLLVNFQNTAQPSVTTQSASSLLFNQMNAYYQDNSYDKISVSGDVAGWMTIPVNQTCDALSTLAPIIQAFDPSVDFTQYSRLVIFAPYGTGCTFSGLSTVGQTSFTTNDGAATMSVSYVLTSYFGLPVTAHEFGHGLGLRHASFYNCVDQAYATTGCEIIEYGDLFSVMGSAWQVGYFNALEKDYFNWFEPSHIQTVTTTGTYTLHPLESGSADLKALKIRRATNDYVYVEYRQPIGEDSDLIGGMVFDGALIHIRGAEGTMRYPNRSFLLATKYFGAASTAPLPVGSTFIDPLTNTEITVLSEGDSELQVRVKMGKTDFTPPTVSVTSPAEGANVTGNFTITVDAQDASGIEKVEIRNAALALKSVIATDTTAPYEFTLDSTMFPQGDAVIIATAYDLSGSPYQVPNNSGTSSFFSFNVLEGDTTPPTVAMVTPTNNSAVKNNVFVEAQADDNGFMSRLELYVDGVKKYFIFGDASAISGTLTLVQGQHTAYAIAYDSAGLSTQSATSTFVVDDTAPTVSITAPEQNALISGTADVSANASDNDQIANVEFFIDGTTKIGEDQSTPYVFSWDTSLTALGSHVVTAKSIDRAGNTTTSSGRTINIIAPQTYICGDADGNALVTISDAVLLINYIFQGGRNPVPLASGDANGDGIITISDAVYLISYVFSNGPAPVCPLNKDSVKNGENPAMGYTLNTFKAAYPDIFSQ